uniref:Fucolectin tachylectin-4 pentraxin-1 domain-containing protein n=1 Tax=Biomphalaria glabrata TaxID=6526 RepID=A0A2C9KID1_BIOGL
DLTILENTVTTPNVSMLTDRDDRTCMNISGQTIVITFNRTYVFTWLRATLNDSASLPGLTVQFSKTTSMTSKLECQNQKYFLLDNATLDIQCDLPEAIRTVIITGTGRTSLCSLYINGGRNVALKQRTWQTSDYSESYAGTFHSSKAVDGNTSSNFYGVLSCSHTNAFDPRPMWSVTFPLSEITRYVIYNRDDVYINRLAKFVLSGEDSAIQKFSYVDASDTGIPVYTVTDPARNKLTQVKINATQFVTLCEVEIYGECKAGKWGRNCVRECSYVCKDQSCDRVTGLCEHICDSLTDLSCPDDCQKGYHGSNCTLECSSTCKDLLCNRLGYCIACVSDYTGRYCEKVQLGLASETSGLTFSSGVGVGVAVGALVIILVVVVIVIICRTRLKTLSAKSNDDLKHDTQLQNYDSVKQIHEYNQPYEPSRSTFE